MHIIIVDVNVLVDEARARHASPEVDEARKLLDLMRENNIQVCITPTMVKDLRYLIAVRTKQFLREKKGQLEPADIYFANKLALDKIDWYLDNAAIISEGLVDCHMARSLLRVHNNFEDNLITAVAIRTDAMGIVTRDEKFAKNCQVKCFTPTQAIQSIEAGLWH